MPTTGFVTEEIRERGRRVGFSIATTNGEEGVLAHVGLPGPPRVGKYGVDLSAFEKLALPSLDADAKTVVVIDELGKMELFSDSFRKGVGRLFESGGRVLATVHVFRHPFTDALKRRDDVEVVRVRAANRDDLPTVLADRLV